MIRSDKIILLTSALLVFLSCLLLLINSLTTQYPVVHFPWLAIKDPSLFPCTLIFIYGLYLSKQSAHLSLIFKSLGLHCLISLVMLIAASGVYTTPFPLHDDWLNNLNSIFHFDTLRFMNLFNSKWWLQITFELIYNFLLLALLVLPIVFAVLGYATRVYTFTLACLIACLMGYGLYYFFPSSAPASILHSIYFPRTSLHLSQSFYLVHHYQTASVFVGFISIPSFHTIWATIMVCMVWKHKSFYLLFAFSILVVISTLTTGWHFLIDDMVALPIGLISFMLARILLEGDLTEKIGSVKRCIEPNPQGRHLLIECGDPKVLSRANPAK